MQSYHFKTMRMRLTVLLVVPVVLIVLVAGIAGFIYARHLLLEQWQTTVILQLKGAAHEIEMRLSRPVELMELFSQSGQDPPEDDLMEAIVRKLETLPGVVRVNLNWHARSAAMNHIPRHNGTEMATGGDPFNRFHRGRFAKINPPRIDKRIGEQTVSVSMILVDPYDTPVGNLEVVIRLDFLMAQISAAPWWRNADACIADKTSAMIVFASGQMQGRKKLGETGDPLETNLSKEINRKPAGTIRGQGFPPHRVAGFHSLDTFPWDLVVFADGRTILHPVIAFRNGFLLGTAVLILLVYSIVRLNANRMAETIRRLSQRAEMVASGDYGEIIPVRSHDEIGRLADSFNTMVEGLRERDAIRNTFGRYVDPKFARSLLKQPEKDRLGGRRQEVAILMADIRRFTPMAEHLSPEETIEVLNRYFSAIIPLIQKYQGIIVDFIGDAILAFFEPMQDSLVAATQRCVQCAVDMQAAMSPLNRQLVKSDLPPLQMGIGINSGTVVVGNIGSETRKKYGIVGSAVNLTQRIQGQSKAGEVVVSQAVVDMVQSRILIQREFSASLKGTTSPLRLYAVAPYMDPQDNSNRSGTHE